MAHTHAHEKESAAPAPDLENENAELKDRLLRALAEQENIRMRARRDVNEAAQFASAAFAKDMLGVADNLRRAMENFPSDDEAGDAVAPLLTGIEATERGLQRTLEKHGITPIDPLGRCFRPEFS